MYDFPFEPGFWIGILTTYLFIVFVIVIIFIAAGWRLFSKAGQPGWAVLIPFYNLYLYTQILRRPKWWILLYFLGFIPFLGALGVLFLSVIDSIRLAKVFGRPPEFGVGLILLNIVFIAILAFGKSDYDAFRVTEGELI